MKYVALRFEKVSRGSQSYTMNMREPFWWTEEDGRNAATAKKVINDRFKVLVGFEDSWKTQPTRPNPYVLKSFTEDKDIGTTTTIWTVVVPKCNVNAVGFHIEKCIEEGLFTYVLATKENFQSQDFNSWELKERMEEKSVLVSL